MDVLVVVTSNARRGAELEGSALATHLVSGGTRSRVVALAPDRHGRNGTDLEMLGPTPTHPTTLRRLRAASLDADVVIAYGSRTLVACSLALLGTGTPFVYRSIGDPAEWLRGPLHRWRTGTLFRRPAHVVALWPRARSDIARLFAVPETSISVIPNARDIADFHPPSSERRTEARRSWGIADDRPVIASLGALAPEKQVDRAVRAMEYLPHGHLLVAGDGSERAAIESLVATSRHSNVTLAGQVADATRILHAADVLVLTSRTEGMPGVIIEAGLCAVPAVATSVGAVPDMIRNEVTGLVTADDSPEAIAAALAAAIERSSEMGKAALHEMRLAYTWESVGSAWTDLLETIAHR